MKKMIRTGVVTLLATTALLSTSSVNANKDNYGGTPAMYGNNPMGPAPGPQSFAPQIFTVVYMKLAQTPAGPALQAQHAYFPLSAGGQADVLGVVNRFRNNSWSGGTAPLPIDGKVRADFHNFTFSQQAKIYIVFDDANAAIVGQRPIYFTRFGANDPTLQTPLDDNESFYNAQVVNFGDPIQAIYFEDWFRDANGKPIPPDPQKTAPGDVAGKPRQQIARYSINFNYRLASALTPGVSIPISIDPDTGNGYDDPPP